MAEILPIFDKKFYTVSELTSEIKEELEDSFFDVWVVGETSNVATPRSGHTYFTLKDKDASIRCVLFKGQKTLLNYDLKSGEEVLLRGRLTVYSIRGEYQIIVDYIEPYGVGKLFLKIEQLKKKLQSEGLFDESFKKALPKYPFKIAVVTSITGAAIRDILNVIKRRFVGVEVYIYPVKVQGNDAAKLIADAIMFINREMKDIEVIIVARGGGSIEDLMSFNDETVARAIFASDIPIISAVGHETDYTIADYVADLRAPTPSVAAEIVVKNREELLIHIDNLHKKLVSSVLNIIINYRNRLMSSEKSLQYYFLSVKNLNIKITGFINTLKESLSNLIADNKTALNNYNLFLIRNNPYEKIKYYKQKLGYLKENLRKGYSEYIKDNHNKFKNLCYKLNVLSPLNVLERGYAIVYKGKNIIKNRDEVNNKDRIKIRLAHGTIIAVVEKNSK